MGCSSVAAKRARTPSTTNCKGDSGKEAAEEEEETTITFSMELECRVCFMPFEAECKNGHGACGDCCIRINRKCWCCSEPVGDLRNRQLGAFLAAMVTPCKFARYGCDESVKYTEKRGHEEACAHAPCGCPFAGCGYRCLDLWGHVRDEHYPPDGSACAAPGRARVFALLNGGDVLTGRSLSLVFLGPRPAEDAELEYTMEVTGGGWPGAPALSASGAVPCARSIEGFQAKGFLFVPDAYWGSSAGSVSVRVRV
ncbi:unnamed protein product [Urochloa decumbens]|uniref:SIAH-type domain-containing protein n=1 Tax=Urochloa decumbens TaxID=240449 RepID=A0ABC8YVV4_9POAL